MKWKIILFCVALLLAAPFIALNYWGFQMSKWTMDVQNTNSAYLNAQLDGTNSAASPEMPTMPKSPFDWLRDRNQRSEILATDRITGEHSVTMSRVVPIKRYTWPNERSIPTEMHDLAATARTPALFAPFCNEIVGTIGHMCQVTSSNARPLGDGTYDVDVTLSFIPNYDLGAPLERSSTDDQTATFSSVRQDRALWPGYTKAARIDIMDKAKLTCEALRAEFGACIIARLIFDEYAQGADKPKMAYRVHFKTFGDGPINRHFEERVNQIATPIFNS